MTGVFPFKYNLLAGGCALLIVNCAEFHALKFTDAVYVVVVVPVWRSVNINLSLAFTAKLSLCEPDAVVKREVITLPDPETPIG